jgi:hypothetical protein
MNKREGEINDLGQAKALAQNETGTQKLYQAPNEEEESTVIRKSGARLIVSNEEDARPESGSGGGIVLEPRVVASKTAEIDLAEDLEPEEEVLRLERAVDPGKDRIKVEKARFEKLEERMDEAEVQEEQWGRSSAVGWGSILVGGSVVIVLVVVLVAMRGVWMGDESQADVVPSPVEGIEQKDPYEGSPEKWMRERSGDIEKRALVVLKGFVEATDDQARSRWVRYPDQYLQHAQQHTLPLNPNLNQQTNRSWDIAHTEDTAYLICKTLDRDYMPVRAYFTQDGELLKLDWEASVAWSDVSLKEIRAEGLKRRGAVSQLQRDVGVVQSSELSPSPKSALPEEIYSQGVNVRCKIRKRNDFYVGAYNDQDHSAYMLLSADEMHHMWGYAIKGSELDRQLKSVLDHGSFVMSLKRDMRVILRVRINEKDTLPSQLELVELVNPEWVTP